MYQEASGGIKAVSATVPKGLGYDGRCGCSASS